MLEQDKAEQILQVMRNLDIAKRLEAVNKAREMFKDSFTTGMSLSEYAFSVSVIEQFYNLLRTELRVDQIRIKADIANPGKIPVVKGKKPVKKEKSSGPDFSQLLTAFADFKKQQEAKSE